LTTSTYAAFGLGVAVLYAALAPPPAVRQPIAFNHVKHGSMACRVCHAGVDDRPRAGLPPAAVCANCHARAPREDDGERAAWKRIEAKQEAGWLPLLRMPAHAYFSHQAHVKTALLACRNCHGQMERESRPPDRPLVTLEMEDCVRCHQKLKASSDCAACHR
jgi:hypothetical protein